jgi:succinate dehydrogenase/fumarate reductase flavoprotein subunit
MIIKNRMKWHKETDVVVVGFGGAGGVSAITAHDEGAEVVILEKQPAETHHTNTSISPAAFIGVNHVSDAVSYMKSLYRVTEGLHWTDEETLQVWAEYCSQNAAWLEKMDIPSHVFAVGGEHKGVHGFESIQIHEPLGDGKALHRTLREKVQSRGIEVMYETPAQKLMTNSRGEIVGVSARKDGKEFNVKASRAVIMAPGGFEYDEEMKLNYLKVYPTYFTGSPANTGDGIRMVQDVGASLWHMNCCSARLVAKFPDFPYSFSVDYGGAFGKRGFYSKAGWPHAFILVDKHGRRYTNDGAIKGHALYYELACYDSQRLEFSRVPSYVIFDIHRMKGAPLPVRAGLTWPQPFTWSEDNSAELEKGWIIQGDTIRELAGKLSMDPDTLEKTVKTYNAYCENKEDPEFHRPPQHLKPILESPFFALRLWPGGPNTQGGPRRNHKGQVLNGDKNPIRRLYAAGEFGSIYGLIYPSAGGNIAECIAFGRIAGENAAKETPLR